MRFSVAPPSQLLFAGGLGDKVLDRKGKNTPKAETAQLGKVTTGDMRDELASLRTLLGEGRLRLRQLGREGRALLAEGEEGWIRRGWRRGGGGGGGGGGDAGASAIITWPRALGGRRGVAFHEWRRREGFAGRFYAPFGVVQQRSRAAAAWASTTPTAPRCSRSCR